MILMTVSLTIHMGVCQMEEKGGIMPVLKLLLIYTIDPLR
jgi:hypothetical protein